MGRLTPMNEVNENVKRAVAALESRRRDVAFSKHEANPRWFKVADVMM